MAPPPCRHPRSWQKLSALAALSLFSTAVTAISAECSIEASCNRERDFGALFLVPYAFYNSSTEFAGAVAFGATGYLQPQLDIVVNGFVSANGSSSGFMMFKDYQIGGAGSRWFLDSILMRNDLTEIKSYRDGNPDFPDDDAGSNDSDQDNFLYVEGTDTLVLPTFRYLLPIGHGRQQPIHTFRLDQGLLEPGSEAGGDVWNPLESGRTTLEIEPFYRKQDFTLTNDSNGASAQQSAGIRLRLKYDNTDWSKNPGYGSNTEIAIRRDWGQSADSPSWTQIEFEYSKYVPLPSSGARQRVVAINAWVSDVPTWNSYDRENDQQIFHRPPVFAGSTLGGLDRQRGFESYRFNDRSAVNYQLEYRHIPYANPLGNWSLLQQLQIKWMQYVLFAELGRVNDRFDITALHRDMRLSAGAGLRLNAMGLVVRADVAVSNEGGQLQMFVGHTF
ncbi:BamA/TamA family outer membrane protein [Motiliproteus sediminis]|uniref:BamA/TamA family outer membrane protein n=1 Tax=Motiliproteus sediminis TaxID=1468178 RepID=UPI001AEF3BEA|nr:BamA/TamA family outer membrane protein [Motiliproteus sediminis]